MLPSSVGEPEQHVTCLILSVDFYDLAKQFRQCLLRVRNVGDVATGSRTQPSRRAHEGTCMRLCRSIAKYLIRSTGTFLWLRIQDWSHTKDRKTPEAGVD